NPAPDGYHLLPGRPQRPGRMAPPTAVPQQASAPALPPLRAGRAGPGPGPSVVQVGGQAERGEQVGEQEVVDRRDLAAGGLDDREGERGVAAGRVGTVAAERGAAV